ncbi:MAG: hypothetical protein ACOY0T_05820 [Myxococcota bacterium]
MRIRASLDAGVVQNLFAFGADIAPSSTPRCDALCGCPGNDYILQ